MVLSLFKKKSVPKTVEEDRESLEEEPVEQEQQPKQSQDVELERIKTQVEALLGSRKVMDEQMRTMTEQLGELRSTIISKEREIKELRAKAERSMDLVDEVQPEKLDMDIKREDSKIQALKDMILANEQRMKELNQQLIDMRKTIQAYKGTEEIIKLNEEMRRDINSFQKIKAMMESHANKVENIFIDVQKNFAEFKTYKQIAETAQQTADSMQKTISEIKKKLAKSIKKKHIKELEEDIKRAVEKTNNMEEAWKKYKEFFTKINVQERLFSIEEKLSELTRNLEASGTYFDDIAENIKTLKSSIEKLKEKSVKNKHRINRLLTILEEMVKRYYM